MDDKTNLYVFEKKEVLLIFVFMLLIAVTSFVLGVKVGKSFTYPDLVKVEEDFKTLELKSTLEEDLEVHPDETIITPDETTDMLRRTMEEEFTQENHRFSQSDTAAPQTEKPVAVEKGVDNLSGKYTIQLGSHRSYEEAEQFARGFSVRGYNPIIKETEIPGRGIWFRVSIGAFDSISEAKEYVLKENSLFQGEDYVFQRF